MQVVPISILLLSVAVVAIHAMPYGLENSPVVFVEVQGPESVRVARKAESSYRDILEKTQAGASYVKTDVNRKIRGARLHVVADGAYPVYYTPGIANGRFGARIFTLDSDFKAL